MIKRRTGESLGDSSTGEKHEVQETLATKRSTIESIAKKYEITVKMVEELEDLDSGLGQMLAEQRQGGVKRRPSIKK
ncbi:MAG: hypothetical protein V1905_02970 [bacterium]